MKYRIGVVSDLLGISQEGLRLYERSGILNTKREASSGNYRTYNTLDITALIRARTYHNYGFSLQEIEKLINTNEIDIVRDCYEDRKKALENDIISKQRLWTYLDEMTALMDALPQDLDTYRICTRPAMYRYEYSKQDDLIISPDEYKDFAKWINLTPFTFASQSNSWKDLINGRDVSVNAMGILSEYADMFGIKADDHVRYYEPCPCVYTVVKIKGEKEQCTEFLAGLMSFVYSKKLKTVGDPIARTFVSLNKRNSYTRFRQIWLPIEQN